MTPKIKLAQEFAHKAHDSINHVRKYTGEPYWVHTDEVALIVEDISGSEDMIMAAHLHDVLEDVTPINPIYGPTEINNQFGFNVLDIVVQLTDVYTREKFPLLNRVERKRREVERLSLITDGAATVKLADLISNTRSIVEHDEGFARTYLKEKWELLPNLKHGHPHLYLKAYNLALDGIKKLNLTLPT